MQPSQHAAAAGIAAPEAQTDERPGGQAEALKEQTTADTADCAAIERERVASHDETLAKLRGRAGTKNITMHVLATGDGGTEIMFSWCGLSKYLPDADAASIWLDHIGAPR